MKQIYLLSVFCISCILCTGCSKFLEEHNPNRIWTEDYYNTEQDIVNGANGAYAALRGTGYCRNMWLYNDVRSGYTSLQDPGANSGVNYQFFNYTLLTDNSQVKTHYADLYKCITRCNIILDHIVDISFTNEEDKNKIIEEMRFLRALTYFYLVQDFGEVPIVTKELKTKEEVQEHLYRQPKSEVYNLIISDLKAVIDGSLPILQIGENTGRVSKAAANALLGKVLLTKAADVDFASERDSNLRGADDALMAAWNVKPFSKIGDVSYADIFDIATQKQCKEILFQVMYLNINSDLSSPFAQYFQPQNKTGLTSQKAGSGYSIVTTGLMGEYEALDGRKALSCATDGSINYVKKYIDMTNADGYGANSWIILRYADVALMLAEVKMYLGQADAAEYLNQVRRRAGLADITTLNRDAIVHERKVELAFEGHIWNDMKRLYTKNELLTIQKAKNENFSDKDFLLPIPYDEVKLNPSGMYQNYGYSN
jgi:hypothetical protein